MTEYEIGSYTEDDRPYELPEYIKKMTPEERQQEMDRLYYEMKNNPKYPKRKLDIKDGKLKVGKTTFFL